MGRFLDSGVTINAMRQTQDSVNSAAAGISRYIDLAIYSESITPYLVSITPTVGVIPTGCDLYCAHQEGASGSQYPDLLARPLYGSIKGMMNAHGSIPFANIAPTDDPEMIDFEESQNRYRSGASSLFYIFSAPHLGANV